MADKVIFDQQLTEVSSTRKDTLGSIREEGGKKFKYVELKNTTATVAVVAGDPVSYFALTGHASGRVVSDVTDADAQPVGAGLMMASAAGTLAVSFFCWIQLTGPAILPTAVTAGVLGSDCMPGVADKTLVVRTGVIHSCAVLTSASGANNTVLCDFPH